MAFPTTPILDALTANGPLSANWVTPWQSVNTIEVVGGAAHASNQDGANNGSAYWNALGDFADGEVYATISDIPLDPNGEWGFRARAALDLSSFVIVAIDNDGVDFTLVLTDTGALFNTYPITPVVGDRIGLKFTGAALELWYFTAGSWSLLDGSATTTVLGAGRIGPTLTFTDAMNDFGGGPVGGGATPTNLAVPTIRGVPYPGHLIEVDSVGSWSGAPTSFSYQWYADAVPIFGETGVQLLLDDTMIGALIAVGVIATNGAGSSPQAFSASIGPVVSFPAAAIPYQSPAWRFVVLDLVTFQVLSLLDVLATGRVITYTLDAPAVAICTVPSASPQVNIPWPDPDSDPFLTEGSRTLLCLRRDGDDVPWTPRHHGMILQLEDSAQSDNAFSHVTAPDPWQYLMTRPVCNADGSLPGPNGLSFGATKINVIAGTLLKNTIVNQGITGIDLGPLYGGTAFYDGTIEDCDEIDINFRQGTTVGEAWQQLTNQDGCDIILTAIYDPFNRPGYLVQASIYVQAGSNRDNAIFAWDKPGRSLVQISRLKDGTLRANKVKFFAGQGGSAAGGESIPVQTDAPSVAKYGEYWRQQFWPGQNVANVVQLLAQAELALSKDGRTTVTISPAPERSPIPFDDYFLGDRVPTYASERLRAPLFGYQRVYGIPLTIADDSVEQVQQLLTSEPTA